MGAKGLSHTKRRWGGGGQKRFWGSFNTEGGSFSHTEGGGGAKGYHPSKGETRRVLPCLEAVGCKMIWTHNFPISPSLY